MTTWTTEELRAIGDAAELRLASLRADGTVRPPVIMWVVRVEDELYVRSGYGRDNPWFRRALTRHAAVISAGGIERAVALEEPGSSVDAAVSAAYHAKYDRYGSANVSPMVTPEAAAATFRLVPRDATTIA